ncbi:MAG: hypothetical protein FWF30_03475 [Coriobacteriia bacterium]|nr:hypothetical protein [Coriobacteriia bacterium]
MRRNDIALLCFVVAGLAMLILVMMVIVLGLSQDVVESVLIIASGALLIVAAIILVAAAIVHIRKNYLEVNLQDIRQKRFLRENKGVVDDGER